MVDIQEIFRKMDWVIENENTVSKEELITMINEIYHLRCNERNLILITFDDYFEVARRIQGKPVPTIDDISTW